MKRLLFLSTLLTSGIFATPLVYNNNFWYSSNDPNLVGLKENFEINSVSLDAKKTGGTFTGEFEAILKFNFGSNTLGPYALSSLQVSAADLFLVQGGAIKYGVPLITHGGSSFNGASTGTTAVDSGDIFQVGGSISTLTSNQLSSGFGAGNFGANRTVWLKNDSASTAGWFAGTSAPTYSGTDCTAATCVTPEFTVKINITASTANSQWLSFLTAVSTGGITPYFTDSTCGNDLLTGVPEPSTYALMTSGLVLLGFRLRRKK